MTIRLGFLHTYFGTHGPGSHALADAEADLLDMYCNPGAAVRHATRPAAGDRLFRLAFQDPLGTFLDREVDGAVREALRQRAPR